MARSPWGRIDYSTVYAPGLRSVGTSGHGGLMISEKFAAKHLSEAAIKRAIKYQEGRYERTARTYNCFEEDVDYAIAAIELLDQYGDRMFAHCAADSEYGTQEGRRLALIRCLSAWNADYLIERGIEPDPEGYAAYLKWHSRRGDDDD